MLAEALRVYPDECCGALLGRVEAGGKLVSQAVPLDNVFAGPHASRYEVRPSDLARLSRHARGLGLDLIGIYHSHPDSGAGFSETDLRNSCPWYSFVVLSLRGGRFAEARSWLPDGAQTKADEEDLRYPDSYGNSNVSDAQ